MVPGKTYKPEDYVEILWRRRWIGIVPFVVVTIGTVVWTQFLPNVYRSAAQVLVVPQQVPENYVETTVTTNLAQRLQSIQQQILSRTRLERIITDLDLYPNERKTMIMEDVVALARANVKIDIARATARRTEPGYFSVTFDSDNPRTAMRVADRVASSFITENLEDRSVQADQTSQFMQTQLDDARRQLAEREQKLEQFRKTYAGQLPTQVPANLQVMQSTQVQLQSLGESIARDRDRQLVLDKLISDTIAIGMNSSQPRAQGGPGTPGAPATARDRDPKNQKNAPPASAAEQLADAKAALDELLLHLKPEHPDVVRARRTVQELQPKADAEALNSPVGVGGAGGEAAAPRLTAGDQKRVSDMQAERESLDRGIAQAREEETRLQAVLVSYRKKIEAAPTREAEQTELMRDYATLQTTYQTLLAKSQSSNMAAALERRQIGEQFRVIDPARLPERPISPNRPRLDMMGAVAGLGLGIALIGLLEYRDTSVRTDEDVTLSLALPVLAVIPLMLTEGEVVRTRRHWRTAAIASLVAAACAVGVVVWKFNVIEQWVR